MHGVNLGAQSRFWVEEAAPKVTVLFGGDDTLALGTNTTWPTSQRTGHVTQV